MTTRTGMSLEQLKAANASARLSKMARFEVTAAGDGVAETGSVVGKVTASHFSMNCLKPAVGRLFVAKGAMVQAGRRQIVANAELFSEDELGRRSLVAIGETLMVNA